MTDFNILIKVLLAAFFSTLFCTWLLRPIAARIGLVDSPGGRKWHENDVPLIGGIAMFFGFCFAMLMLPVSLHSYRGLLAGSGLLILIGVVDDFRELGSKLRLLGQVFASFFLIIWGNQSVQSLGNLFFFGDILVHYWSFPLTVFLVLGFINAMNMIDGQDGLAGGVALTQTICLFILSLFLHRPDDAIFLGIIATLLSAFLFFNLPLPWRKKASVFLGDAGSTFIAFIIAWFAIDLSQSDMNRVPPMAIMWVLALPLFDLVNVCTYRINNGISPFKAGRDHLHHILFGKGITTSLSTFLLCILSLSFGLAGIVIAVYNLSESWAFLAYFATLICYLFFIDIARNEQEIPK